MEKIKKLKNLAYLPQLRKLKETVFFRDDDVDILNDSIIRLTKLFENHHIPLSYQVIPGTIDQKFIEFFLQCNHRLFDICQHGLHHTNYGGQGEFGRNRTIEEKRNDIQAGKKILQNSFGNHFTAIFTPPWNKMDTGTFLLLKEEGFKAFSVQAEHGISKWRHMLNIKKCGLFDLSESVDMIADWDTAPRGKSITEIIESFEKAKKEFPIIGIMLHDKKMTDEDFQTLEAFLDYLKKKNVTVRKMSDILDILSH